MLATMADAHREWHLNSGVPMGLPGCPQDACHTDYMDHADLARLARQRDVNFAFMRGEEGDAVIRCAHCFQVHLSVDYARACATGVPVPAPAYEACEHGLSASLCAGPGHYPADER